MNLDHLAVFVEVVRSGTMSSAADVLFLSQPAVSKTIARLEQQFDTTLFDRIGTRLIITDSGRKLYRYALQMLDQEAQMIRSMQGQKQTLRIGGTLTVGSTLLTDIIKTFQDEYPNLGFKAKITNTREIEELLLQSSLDIALVEGVVKSPHLVFHPVIEDRLVLACTQSHPLAGRASVFLDELSDYSFHQREMGSGTRALFESFMMRRGYDIHAVYESTCPLSIRNSMEDFDLLSVLSFRLVEDGIRSGKFYAFAPENEDWKRSFSIVYHRDKLLTPLLKTFIRHIERYKDDPFPEELIRGKILIS